jgi:heme/copper-type cytochrome/quinol oxidase subunit 2
MEIEISLMIQGPMNTILTPGKKEEITDNSQDLVNLYLFMITISVAAIFVVVIYVIAKKRPSIT